MAQIKPSDQRYRTKDEIARDIAFILNADVTYGTKHAVMNDAMWVWTEFQGKYQGCPYWTPLAMARFALNPKGRKHGGLRHEHIVPRSVVIQMLRDLESPTTESVYAICDKFLIGVVVTEEEDALLNFELRKSMPPEFYDTGSAERHDPWLRYRRCNIQWGTEEAVRQALASTSPHLKL